MYYVYHIEGKKVGCTKNLKKRVEQEQGYKKYKILFKSNDIKKASNIEKYYQEKLRYKVDINTYEELINNNKNKLKTKKMIHVTNHTITFKKTFNKKLDNFILPAVIELDDGFIIPVDDKIEEFILNNNYKSQNNNERYVYTNSLKNYYKTLEDFENTNIFDKIRSWAKERGIYEKGDPKTQYIKLMEEAGELAQALLKQDELEIYDAIGDMVIVLTNLAKLKGVKIEDCINNAYKVIESRKGEMINGTFQKKAS